MSLARQSSAPRKMPGNASTLLIWLGKSLLPVPTTAAPASFARSGMISGVGFAIAKMIASLFMLCTISLLTQPAAEIPRKTSAPTIASASLPVLCSRLVISAISRLTALSFSSPLQMMPLLSHMVMCLTPMFIRCLAMAMPAAPAPFITTLISSIFLPVIFRALSKPAATMIAVPCWSSWKIGISHFSLSFFSISKQRGAEISSKLMPPKLPLIK